MRPVINFYKSSIGKKWIVALTGIVLVGYVIGHLIGNLQIFISPEQINWYGEKLHSMGPFLWVIRAFLLGCFAVHILTTILLVIENRKARPERYAVKKNVRTTAAALTMVVSGIILLAFVIFHLLHFTARPAELGFTSYMLPNGHTDIYKMIIRGFLNPFITAFYIVGMFLLCMHLSHGLSSLVQTLGLNSKKTDHAFEVGGTVLAWLIFAGFTSIPVSVILGIIK